MKTIRRANQPLQQSNAKSIGKGNTSSTFARVARYTLVRALVLSMTAVVAVYLAIFVANLGGFVDQIVESNIYQAIAAMRLGGWLQGLPAEEQAPIIEQTIWQMEEAAGLHEPFLLRTARWLWRGLTLDWGKAKYPPLGTRGKDAQVRALIRESLPRTLLVFGSANLLLFLSSVALALSLTKRRGGWLDRIVVTLAPMGAIPTWAYSIILGFVLPSGLFALFSVGRDFDVWPDEFTLSYIPLLIKYMALPLLAIFCSGLFKSVYAWRAFFSLHVSEDYVEMARAKGLPSRLLQQRYILKPGLPSVITSFVLMLISLWQDSIILEQFFGVSGVGERFYYAIMGFDIPMILGLVVSFAYLLVITVFVLDIIYALVDPRINVGGASHTVKAASRKRERARLARGRLHLDLRPRIASAKAACRRILDAPGSLSRTGSHWRRWRLSGIGRSLKPTLRDILRTPSAIVGLAIIAILIGVSIYTAIAIPYQEAIGRWRGEENLWYKNPKKAWPEWINLFREDDLPRNIIMNSQSEHTSPDSAPHKPGVVIKSTTPVAEGMTEIMLAFPFDYPYSDFPQDLHIYFTAQYDEKRPLLSLSWLTPDGREIEIPSFPIAKSHVYRLSLDEKLQRRLGQKVLRRALFADPAAETTIPLQGRYELRVSAFVFEKGSDVDAEFILYGQVYGWAGTDDRRRDLTLALLWGAPVALSFGLLAAVGTTISNITIAATGVWFGGWVDSLIQRITEVNMVLPFLPVSIMVYLLYSKSFWAVLTGTVLLSVFGSGIKSYRAIFLQVREAPYIDAARAYGASDRRIIFRYLIPRISAVVVPQLVVLIPSYVFLEAALAYLGVSDPVFPTWGKLIAARRKGAVFADGYNIELVPIALLVLTGLAFVMVGLALERIFEPRLREM